jgi:hypothetical protein
LGWVGLFIRPVHVVADGDEAETPRPIPAGETISCENRQHIADGIDALMIYRIRNGKADSIVIAGKELRGREHIRIGGYASGVVVLCDPEMRISIDGREPHRIKANLDGTLWIENYGKVALDDIVTPRHKRCCDGDLSLGGSACREDSASIASGYSLFPEVFGDSLSLANQLEIAFGLEEESSSFSIQQDDFCTLPRNSLYSKAHSEGLIFRYLGARIDQIEKQVPDFNDRLRAIEEGIESVESVFGGGLVKALNIIDYESVKDAVACDGRDDIWIYVDALLEEPLEELKTIAMHEALHVLVDKNRFARDSEVRELFAGLRGHDEFSRERFSIVTSGTAPPREAEHCLENGAFFAFINERNFIEGMKGGHSHDSVEDFSVSFMHSLMFLERFENNLNRPVLFSEGAGGPRPLTDRERDFVVDSYIEATETFIRALDHRGETSATTKAFLKQKLGKLAVPKINREPQS